jgi:hypothetical protein
MEQLAISPDKSGFHFVQQQLDISKEERELLLLASEKKARNLFGILASFCLGPLHKNKA